MRRRDRGAPEAAGSRTVFLHRCFALAPVNRLFSIAHNALTNTFRHARAGRVEVELDFGVDSIQLSVSDDGVGLPDEYAQRGHGFAGMRTDTEAMGGRLIVETLGRRGGTTVTCTIPYEQAAEGDHDFFR